VLNWLSALSKNFDFSFFYLNIEAIHSLEPMSSRISCLHAKQLEVRVCSNFLKQRGFMLFPMTNGFSIDPSAKPHTRTVSL
jgi:hypothetical protein